MAATTKDGLLLDRKILRKQIRSARDTIGSLRSELAEARAERDAAIRERDERPDITGEQAFTWIGCRGGPTEKRVYDALRRHGLKWHRAHAAGSDAKGGDDG